jgi:hypothetical protein
VDVAAAFVRIGRNDAAAPLRLFQTGEKITDRELRIS